MRRQLIAIPANNPGGLTGQRSDHFGHCEQFTLVELTDGQVGRVETMANLEHEAGGCLRPVALLQARQVDAIIVGGIGKRPLAGFQEAGIAVYWAALADYPGVGQVVAAMGKGELSPMALTQVCAGGGNCKH